MKEIIVLIFVLVSLFSCSKSDVVQVSGRIENGDSIVSILVDDSIYTLSLDQQGFFSGKIDMVKEKIVLNKKIKKAAEIKSAALY